MTPQHQIVKIESVKVWVTRLPSLSHPPLSMWRHRVTCFLPKNASAPWGGRGSRWLAIIIWQVSYIQYLLACQKSQRSTPYNIVKSGLPWKRLFRRRHLGRRMTAVTCLRWPTVYWDSHIIVHLPTKSSAAIICQISLQKSPYAMNMRHRNLPDTLTPPSQDMWPLGNSLPAHISDW